MPTTGTYKRCKPAFEKTTIEEKQEENILFNVVKVRIICNFTYTLAFKILPCCHTL